MKRLFLLLLFLSSLFFLLHQVNAIDIGSSCFNLNNTGQLNGNGSTVNSSVTGNGSGVIVFVKGSVVKNIKFTNFNIGVLLQQDSNGTQLLNISTSRVNISLYINGSSGAILINPNFTSNVQNILVARNSTYNLRFNNDFGSVLWNLSNNISSGNLSLGTVVNIANNLINVSSELRSELNNSATVMIQKGSLASRTVILYKGNSPCSSSICTSIVDNGTAVTFRTTQFSSYSLSPLPVAICNNLISNFGTVASLVLLFVLTLVFGIILSIIGVVLLNRKSELNPFSLIPAFVVIFIMMMLFGIGILFILKMC